VVSALLEVHLGVQLPAHLLSKVEDWCEKLHKDSLLGRTFRFLQSKGVLLYLTQPGFEPLFKAYLLTSFRQAEVADPIQVGKALLYTAQNGHKAVIKLLLAIDLVGINSKDNDNRTPLSFAAKGGHKAVVKLFLGTGQVGIESKVPAAAGRHSAMLLQRGMSLL
jgi:hypothetical protein